MSDLDVEALTQIALEASRVIQRHYGGSFSVDYKSPGDPVTEADREANQLLCSRIAELYPDAAIVAEESEPEDFEGFQKSERVFFVDPLDGTREFVARNGQFVVMIGAVLEDRAVAGIVCAPDQGKTWVGVPGRGAYRLEADGTRVPVRVAVQAAADPARVMVSRSRRTNSLREALERLGVRPVPMGSAGLKGAQVAEGRAHGYLSMGKSGKLWDACAVDALVVAAGGCFTDTSGRRIDYRASRLDLCDGILAAEPHLHQRMLKALASV